MGTMKQISLQIKANTVEDIKENIQRQVSFFFPQKNLNV
jgi:hypothetical protein